MTHDLFTKSLQQVALVGTAVCGGRSLPLSSHLWRSPARGALRSPRWVWSLQGHLSAPRPGRPAGSGGKGRCGDPGSSRRVDGSRGPSGAGTVAQLRVSVALSTQCMSRSFLPSDQPPSLSLSLSPAPLNFPVKKIDMYISENSNGPRRAGPGPQGPEGRAGGARAAPGAEARGQRPGRRLGAAGAQDELSFSDACSRRPPPPLLDLCFFSSCVIFSSSELGSRGLL